MFTSYHIHFPSHSQNYIVWCEHTFLSNLCWVWVLKTLSITLNNVFWWRKTAIWKNTRESIATVITKKCRKNWKLISFGSMMKYSFFFHWLIPILIVFVVGPHYYNLHLNSWLNHSHKKQHSGNTGRKIWALKLRFLVIYENMLKSIAMAHSERTAKHENKASYNKNYIIPDLIDFFGDDWKEIEKQIDNWYWLIFIIVKNIVLSKNLFVVSNFWEIPKHDTHHKIMFWQSVFPTKNQS